MNNNTKKKIKIAISVLLLFIWLGWDLYQANANIYSYRSSYNASESKASTTSNTTVAVITSDDSTLANPSTRTADPTYQTIEQMVRKAVNLAGGFSGIIKSGMTVLIKPNIVDQAASGSGEVTDIRVVEAVVKMVDEIDHGNIKILVGDGSPRPYTTFEKANSSGKSAWVQLFDVPGYQTLDTQMVALGINMQLVNLNGTSDTNPIPELKEVDLANGQAQPQGGKYFINQVVLNADVYISIPVMKIHDPGLTCALKDQIGICPSSLYGFSKTAGTPSDNYQHMLTHTAQVPYVWTDKEIVDLSTIAKIKFVVIDALMCLDIEKSLESGDANQVRMNTIVAGVDPVAVDHVCCRLMGLNPDDEEHITLAERMGLGTNDSAKINIAGANVYAVMKRFRKNTSVATQMFGQSNRYWLLNGTYPIGSISNPIEYAFIPNEAALSPLPGQNGWSQSTYFINDRINLGDYYKAQNINTNSVVSYAFTYFNAPATQNAELWVGSDEALKIWLNGSVVYDFTGTRTFANDALLSEIVTIPINKGINRLLVKTLQNINTSYYDFSLNICDVEPNPLYHGNRVWGLRFINDTTLTAVKNNNTAQVTYFVLENNYPNPFNPSTVISYQLSVDSKVSLKVYDILGKEVATLVNEEQKTGEYKVNFNAINLSSGIYLYQLRAGKYVETKKMVLIK
jgi:uncharacterized protein (DUF362 family)